MAGEKTAGKLLGWLLFHVIGWRRFIAALLALIVGWAVAAVIFLVTLGMHPKPTVPTGDSILNDKYFNPRQWQSTDPDYVARREKAESDHAAEMERYNTESGEHDQAMNLAGAGGIAAGCLIAWIVYRQARRQLLSDPGPSESQS